VADGRDPENWLGPKGCGNSFSITFHLLFQVIVSQVFLNLFIAIIIDAFFGQTELSNMPVKEKTAEDFQRIWAHFDPNATGFISLGDLELLLVDLANAHPEEGGSMIPFKKRVIGDRKFRNRLIISLKIPTYGKLQKVMFYDVILALCFQATKLYFGQEQVKQVQRQLKVIKMFGAGVIDDDTLEAVHSNVQKGQFDEDFHALLAIIKETSKSELIQEIQVVNTNLQKVYNHEVDTNVKVNSTERAAKLLEKDKKVEVELLTTAHVGSALLIYAFIEEYLERKRSIKDVNKQHGAHVRNASNLEAVAEVSSL